MVARSVLVLAVVAAGLMPAHAAEPKSKDVDLVLCLDVSNSMDGLIDSAKIRLWDIVNELAKVKPTPNLRVALYSYGHMQYPREKGWVRKDLDLTTDLDDVYAKLNALKTNGGEEYVGRVTSAALADLSWSKQDGALKIIFVCGNEPATQDPEIKLDAVSHTAKVNKVIVNTIYCGNADSAEARGWSNFARDCGGKYANIDQNKARHSAIATPFDKELNDLSSKLNATYVSYGKREAREFKAANQTIQDANAAANAPAAGAARAISKAEAMYRNGDWDLIDKLKDDPKFDISTIKDEDLCDEMKKLKPEERMPYLKKKAEERAAIQKTIGEVSLKRQKYLDEESKKQPKNPGEAALDEALKSMIRDQASTAGFEVKK